MKSSSLAALVTLGLLAIGCGSDPEEETTAPQPRVVRLASSIERRLTAPIAVPDDTGIGGSIDALVEAREAAIPREPIVKMGANGKRCTTIRFDDENGVEQMRREQCGSATDSLRIGSVVYKDQNGDGKIDQVSDASAATYEVFDDDGDGKLDRIVESAERIKTPIALGDFGDVVITGGGTIASRERMDKDHDGKFDVEAVTATTSFQIGSAPPKP